MAFLVNENRPMMLKDFLRDDCCQTMYPCKSTAIIFSKPNKPSIVLLRSRSKKAAATTISAIHKVINVVKFFQFASAKSPSNISRKILAKRNKGKNDILGDDVSEVKVKVKDILRWKSFRDMVEDNSSPLDFPSSPDRSTATTNLCSERSSWCESDFTAEELPLWGGENEGIWGKKCFLGQTPVTNTATLRNPKRNWSFEESEQQSPVSVFDDSPFRQVEEPISAFRYLSKDCDGARCMLERRMQELEIPKCQKALNFGGEITKCKEVDQVEEKAKKLLSQLEEAGRNKADEGILLEFFMHEFSINGKLNDVKFDSEILRNAKSWINGEFDESFEWEWEDKREAYVKDMDKGVCWNKFKQEQEEMTKELEVMVWDELIDELLADLHTR